MRFQSEQSLSFEHGGSARLEKLTKCAQIGCLMVHVCEI